MPSAHAKPESRPLAGRRDRAQYRASFGIQLLDHLPGDLKKMLAVGGRAGVGRDWQPPFRLPGLGIEGLQMRAGRDPGQRAIVADASHVLDPGKGSHIHARFSALAAGGLERSDMLCKLAQRAFSDE